MYSDKWFWLFCSVRLHAHVKDFLTCSALCSVWLRHNDNLVKPDYCQLVMTYIDCVLIIQRRWDDVKPFLESCPGLDDIKMKDFLKQTQKVKHHIEQENLDKIETIPTETSATECTPDKITKKTDEVGKSWGSYLLQWLRIFSLILIYIFFVIFQSQIHEILSKFRWRYRLFWDNRRMSDCLVYFSKRPVALLYISSVHFRSRKDISTVKI